MITDTIRRKREQRGYSQEYIADRLGISPSAYRRLESGESKLDIDRLRGITEVLEVDLLELLASEAVTVNVQEQQGGANGCHNVVNQNGVSEEALQAITERYDTHVKELQEMNKRLLALLEKQAGA